ncbi:unnamed protein product [Spirodela intermedia]|uniref:HVA22-like protein n=1 Tax=Spirodela intermedia TaxID=51605 RepID=A0A7I8J1E1_SPIIN|nr:unnamed protein product [Spirodela intermedia]CAA6664036.1 unnamed protein product [Spirodela intermedia]
MDQLWIVLNHLQSLVGPGITLMYPLYASVRAIESPSSVDDEQWLAYWILYSFLTLTEMVAEPVLNWFPMWYHVKVAFMAWLVLPQFRGPPSSTRGSSGSRSAIHAHVNPIHT